MKSTKVIAGILLIFALGAVAGILITRMVYESRFDALFDGDTRVKDAEVLKRLSRQLDLDEKQKERIQIIVREIRQEMAGIHQPARPQAVAALVKGRERIKQILRPDQLEAYQKILDRKKQRRMDRERTAGNPESLQ